MTFELVLLGLACSLEPIPLTGFILTLSTKNGTRNGLGFLIGWVLSLAAVVGITLAITAGKPPAPSTAPANGVLAAKIAIGVGLLAFAWHYRTRPQKEQSDPKWMSRMDRMSVWTAALLAFLLQPWALVSAGALSITQADTSNTSDVLSIVLFCLLATLSLLVMEGYAVLAPEAARARLDGLRSWINNHRQQMIVYLSVIVGVMLISKSAYALAG